MKRKEVPCLRVRLFSFNFKIRRRCRGRVFGGGRVVTRFAPVVGVDTALEAEERDLHCDGDVDGTRNKIEELLTSNLGEMCPLLVTDRRFQVPSKGLFKLGISRW